MLESGMKLLIHDLIGFGEVLATLGVADQGMRSADGQELANRGLTGVRTLLSKVHILAADGDIGTLGGSNDGGQQDGRRKQGNLITGMPGNKGQKGIDEGLRFCRGLEHLPIGGNQGFTGHFVRFLMKILVDGNRGMG